MKYATFAFALLLALSGTAEAQTWTAPTAAPPNGNAYEPVNIGTVDQVKNAGLSVNAFSAFLNAYFAQKVGIGTAPQAKLHISNNVSSGNIDAYLKYQILTYDSGNPASSYGQGIEGNTMWFNSGAGAYKFFRGGSAVSLFMDTAGNVGIGTNSPLRKLAIKGTGTDNGFIEFHNSGNDIPYVGFGYDQTNDGMAFKYNNGTGDFNGTAMFIARATSGSVAAGNVGIGVIAPSQKLDVGGYVKGTGVCIGTDCRTAWPAVGGSGTVSSIAAGTGITVSPSPITTTGTISADTTYLQRRVTGTCAAGNAIQTIASDGSVTCQASGSMTTPNLQTVTAAGNTTNLGISTASLLTTGGASFSGNVGIGITNPTTGRLVVSDAGGGVNATVDLAPSSSWSQLYVGRHIDAKYNEAYWGGKSLFLGWASDKTILGNGGAAGDGFGGPTALGAASNVWSKGTLGVGNDLLVSGKVGVGMTAPAYKLDIQAIAIAANQSDGIRVGGGNDQYSTRMMSLTTSGGVPYSEIRGPKDSNGWLAFTSGTADGEKMRITGSGNVGIGNTAPGYKLDVNGNANATGLCIAGDCKTAWSQVTGTTPNLQAVTTAGNTTNVGISTASLFTTGGASVSGSLGVGTASPGRKLVVYGGHIGTELQLYSIGDGGSSTGIMNLWASEPGLTYTGVGISNNIRNFNGSSVLTRDNTTRGGSYIRLLDNEIRFNTVNGSGGDSNGLSVSGGSINVPVGVSASSIFTSGSAAIMGNLGVGNSSPGFKLEVTGSVGAQSFFYTSDRRLKKDINPLENSLDKVLQLEGVSFSWKKDDKKSIGLVAQDVEKVYPELVNTNSETGIKSVEYGNLVAPLIEAIKEQQKQIETLRKELRELKETK